jgi:hypothetical protein
MVAQLASKSMIRIRFCITSTALCMSDWFPRKSDHMLIKCYTHCVPRFDLHKFTTENSSHEVQSFSQNQPFHLTNHKMASQKCAICNSPGAKSCSSCHSAAYCTTTYQKTDWPLHKTICKTLTALPPRPSPSHKLGILFPSDAKIPEFIWIPCERKFEPSDWDENSLDEWEHAEVKQFLGKQPVSFELKSIRRNILRGLGS